MPVLLRLGLSARARLGRKPLSGWSRVMNTGTGISIGDHVGPNLALLAAGLHSSGSAVLQASAEALLSRLSKDCVLAERDYLLARASLTRTAPMLCQLSRQHVWLRHDVLDGLEEIARISQRVLLENALPLTKGLTEQDIDFAFIKGSDYIWSIYPPELPRQMADIDIIVKPPVLNRVTEVAEELGFFQGAFNRDTLINTPLTRQQRDDFLRDHYELPPFLKLVEAPELISFIPLIERYFSPKDYVISTGDDVFILVQVDAHFNLSFDLSLEDIWRGARALDMRGTIGKGLSWETHVWFLAARIYVEATNLKQPCLRSFVDLAAILAKVTEIEWGSLREVASRYKLYFPFLYVFSHLKRIEPLLVPRDFLEFCWRECKDRLGDSSDNGDILAILTDSIRLHEIDDLLA